MITAIIMMFVVGAVLGLILGIASKWKSMNALRK